MCGGGGGGGGGGHKQSPDRGHQLPHLWPFPQTHALGGKEEN